MLVGFLFGCVWGSSQMPAFLLNLRGIGSDNGWIHLDLGAEILEVELKLTMCHLPFVSLPG